VIAELPSTGHWPPSAGSSTPPLKALSNQKYGDFIRQYGSDLVGILTGDVK
jgi:hypothetical protein